MKWISEPLQLEGIEDLYLKIAYYNESSEDIISIRKNRNYCILYSIHEVSGESSWKPLSEIIEEHKIRDPQ